MLDCKQFYDTLVGEGVDLFAGVPDSLLKDFCAYVTDNTDPRRNVITANEGSAIALAAGHHLATRRFGLVYMQNSGLGNTVNPVTSLADPDVYGVPMLMLVGWRGEPGVKDEPQHVKMGKVTLDVLKAMGVEHAVLPDSMPEAVAAVGRAVSRMREASAPYALVVKKGTFDAYKLRNKTETTFTMSREEAIVRVVEALPPDAVVVATTGMPSRELFETRERRKEGHDRDFLTVGSMGHASQIALGVALARPERSVWCLDGDGAVLMHMGGLASIGALAPNNYKHVVLNNGAHDSVGGQPTVALKVDLPGIARASGYRAASSAEDDASLVRALAELARAPGPALVEARVKKGNRADLGRPTVGPRDTKTLFMTRLAGG